MKLTALFLTIGILNVCATGVSQTISFSGQNVPLKSVFSSIEKQTDFVFMYSGAVLKLSKPVTISAQNVDLKQFLSDVFKSQPLVYVIEGKNVFVSPKPVAAYTGRQESKTTFDLPVDTSIHVTGRVVDENGQPMDGVNIVVMGKNKAQPTDRNGQFSIEAQQGDILLLTYIGYVSQQHKVSGNSTNLTIQLMLSASALADIAVVGYGTQRKSDLTGSVSTIKSSTLTNLPGLRVDQMLQGKASGVLVTPQNGAPGAPSSIRVRGNNSISASSEALYVIDGLIGGGDLSTINPADIEDISILKDASATAIYGSRGANGVILITTKKGSYSGKTQININNQQGWQWLPRKIALMNGSQYAALLNKSRLATPGGVAIYPDPSSVPNTDWQDEIYQTAHMSNLNLSINGGNEKVRYFLSGNLYQQDGIVRNTSADRLQLRANIETKLSDKIKVGTQINMARVLNDNNVVTLSVPYGILSAPPSIPVYDNTGNFFSQHPSPNFMGAFDNPVAQLRQRESKSVRSSTIVNAYVEYAPVDWMTLKSTFGGILAGYNRNQAYTQSGLPSQVYNQQGGLANINYSDGTSYQNENTINFRARHRNDHYIDGLLGLTFQGGSDINAQAAARGFVSDATTVYNLAAGDPLTRTIGSGYTASRMTSVIARANYKYKDRYLLTATGREDGSSRLGNNNKWGFFPSLALGWIASEEAFIKNLDVFSFLKLRGSYGSVGNQAVGIYQTLPTLGIVNVSSGESMVTAWAPLNVGNNDLRWEVKTVLDFGIEANFFNDRLNFNLDYYNSKTNGLLLNVEVPNQTGFLTQITNIGKVSNVGWELAINSDNIRGSNFKWTSQLIVSKNSNKVLQLGPSNSDIITHRYSYGLNPVGILRAGQPIGSFYGAIYEGTWKSDEEIARVGTMKGVKPGSQRYKDVNGDGIFNLQDYVILGNGAPTWYGSINNHISYKGFGLDLFFTGATDVKIFNASFSFLGSNDAGFNHYVEQLNAWDPVTNPTSNIPGNLNGEKELVPSTRWIEDASYVRLESASLSYSLPLKKRAMRYIQRATINVTGTNLFCISPYNKHGYDPVVNQIGGTDYGYNNSLTGFDYGAYPRASIVSLGINLGF